MSFSLRPRLLCAKEFLAIFGLLIAVSALALPTLLIRPSSQWTITAISPIPEPSAVEYPKVWIVFEATPNARAPSRFFVGKAYINGEPGPARDLRLGDNISMRSHSVYHPGSDHIVDSLSDFDSILYEPQDLSILKRQPKPAEHDQIDFAHRLPHLGLVPENSRKPLVSQFLEFHSTKQDAEYHLILGDSQFFGYRLADSTVFSAQLPNFLNLAIPSSQPEDAVWILSQAEIQDLGVGTAIYAFDIINFAEKIQGKELAPFDSGLAVSALDYRHFRKLQDALPSNPAYPGSDIITVNNSAKYTWSESRRKALTKICETLRTSCKQALIVIQPHSIEALEAGGLLGRYRESIQIAKEAISNTGVPILDLSESFPNEHFFDPTHLTAQGHELLLEHISAKLLELENHD